MGILANSSHTTDTLFLSRKTMKQRKLIDMYLRQMEAEREPELMFLDELLYEAS